MRLQTRRQDPHRRRARLLRREPGWTAARLRNCGLNGPKPGGPRLSWKTITVRVPPLLWPSLAPGAIQTLLRPPVSEARRLLEGACRSETQPDSTKGWERPVPAPHPRQDPTPELAPARTARRVQTRTRTPT